MGWRVAGARSSQLAVFVSGLREAGKGACEDLGEQRWRQVGQEGRRPRGGDELGVCSEPPGGQYGWGLGYSLKMEQTVSDDGSGVT